MSSGQGPENEPTSHLGPDTPATADDLVRHLDRAGDDSPTSPPDGEGLAQLMQWMAQDAPSAPAPSHMTPIDGGADTLSTFEPADIPETLGYRGPTACTAAGITYRQLDYWARTGLVEPSLQTSHASGPQRLYGFRDVVLLKIIKRFLDTGLSLQIIRHAVQRLRSRPIAELAGLTLMSDGTTIHECSTPDEVHALLDGQGIYGIAVGVVVRDVVQALGELPGESIQRKGSLTSRSDTDELARRRHRAG